MQVHNTTEPCQPVVSIIFHKIICPYISGFEIEQESARRYCFGQDSQLNIKRCKPFRLSFVLNTSYVGGPNLSLIDNLFPMGPGGICRNYRSRSCFANTPSSKYILLKAFGNYILIYTIFFKGYTGKLSAVYRKKTAVKTDERVRLIDEVVNGVQVIKMYAWEMPFGKLIRYIRKIELKIITKSSYVRALFVTFNLFTTRVALFCTLLTMALAGEPITATKVNSSINQ